MFDKKAYEAEYGKTRRAALKQEALEHYGTKCAICGYDNPLALQLDHIDNDGAQDRRNLMGAQYKAGWNYYAKLKQLGWPPNLQTLCANCNLVKYYSL